MNKKLLVLAIIFLLNILYCTAIDSGTNYTVWEVPVCYDTLYVKVDAESNVTSGEYIINGCGQKEENLWECVCDGDSFPVVLYTQNKTKNEYDFRVQYYILPKNGTDEYSEQLNQMNRRIKNINNIRVGPPKKPFKFPFLGSFDTAVVIGVVVFIIVLIFFVLVIGFKFVMREKTDKEEIKTNKSIDENEPTDEEVQEFLRNNI